MTVGDRVDKGILPALLPGVGTVLFRTGRHRAQQPRSCDELPDFEATGVDRLRVALAGCELLSAGGAP